MFNSRNFALPKFGSNALEARAFPNAFRFCQYDKFIVAVSTSRDDSYSQEDATRIDHIRQNSHSVERGPYLQRGDVTFSSFD